ncbi:acetylornithine deacetylase [Acuticoccus sp. I52.16.1]|uniref:acetylornithine deacetylase n=1 Tax=Acuticoccus sp. I52.16.1 TaxID=2928472 RepID=UPI001FD569CD|nr:acetylornithine deacetylase [Acuticoccus sp. I52.16.1]UOM35785.1 acetylornithine deacetylase [Acuticoccus sp. I52.16.1]
MTLTPTQMLERLVAFPTVSSRSNLELMAFVKDTLAQCGVTATLLPDPSGEKANLYATVGPMVEGGVVLSGHTDVVPAEEDTWSAGPWALTRRDGRLYGRGACDMKGFDALVLAAVPAMVAAGLAVPIHIALSYDEEVGCRGAPPLIAAMKAALPAPRAVIVGEPTRMRPVGGHKGSFSFHTHVTGHAVHSSRIDIGVSAVMTAARLITWLEDRMAANARAADPASPFVPPYTTIHCGMIQGGTAANIVSDRCRFVTDMRVVPPEDPEVILAEYERHIREVIEPEMKRKHAGAGVRIERRSDVAPLMPDPGGGAEALFAALGVGEAPAAVSYGTEAGLFQRAGWPAMVCGPGDIAQAHQADEYLEESELAKGERFIARLIAHLAA